MQGVYVDTAGKNTAVIKQYIADQLKADKESGQLSFFVRVTCLREANNDMRAARSHKRILCAANIIRARRV